MACTTKMSVVKLEKWVSISSTSVSFQKHHRLHAPRRPDGGGQASWHYWLSTSSSRGGWCCCPPLLERIIDEDKIELLAGEGEIDSICHDDHHHNDEEVEDDDMAVMTIDRDLPGTTHAGDMGVAHWKATAYRCSLISNLYFSLSSRPGSPWPRRDRFPEENMSMKGSAESRKWKSEKCAKEHEKKTFFFAICLTLLCYSLHMCVSGRTDV